MLTCGLRFGKKRNRECPDVRDRRKREREALRAWVREAFSKGLRKAAAKRCTEALASDMLRR